MSNKIGKMYYSEVKFYDMKLKKNSTKQRPVLLINKSDATDYTALPISTISNSNHINTIYDYKVDPAIFTKSGLIKISYIRTNKQLNVNLGDLGNFISDFKNDYPEEFEEVIKLNGTFNLSTITNELDNNDAKDLINSVTNLFEDAATIISEDNKGSKDNKDNK